MDPLLPPDPTVASRFPLALLARYLFFLSRRPISSSNRHFLERRLAALRSLVPLLDGETVRRQRPALADALREAANLTPASFTRRVPGVVAALAPFLPPERPQGAIASPTPPPADFFRHSQRVLLALGPGIGIGDEILSFPVGRFLERACPGAALSVLSGYRGLWSRSGVTGELSTYGTLAQLVGRVREGGFDLVVLIDFEKPALAAALDAEPGVARYVEISLGARGAWAFDKRTRWLHHGAPREGSFGNYYAALGELLRWLAPDAARDRGAHPSKTRAWGADSAPTLFVSPFTSKFEHDGELWSRLIAEALPAGGPPWRLLFDAGANLSTEGAAVALARAVRGRGTSRGEIEVARSTGKRTLDLTCALDRIAESTAVLVADSFAAHAAPVLGAAALVVARQGFEDWRVPGVQNYYFDETEPVSDLALALRAVLERLVAPVGRSPAGAGASALEAGERLAERLAADEPRLTAVLEAYGELEGAIRAALAYTTPAAGGPRALLADRIYGELLPPLPPALSPPAAGAEGLSGERTADLLAFVRDRFELWRSSNLAKFLALGARVSA